MPIRIAYDPQTGFDLVNNGGLETDDGLETAIILSLFTDARATEEELLAAGLPLDDAHGFWGDTYPEVEGDRIGSKLWLLARAKRTDATLQQAKSYTEDALAWLTQDGIARTVTVTTEWYGTSDVVAVGVLIERDGSEARWFRLWNAISGELLEAA